MKANNHCAFDCREYSIFGAQAQRNGGAALRALNVSSTVRTGASSTSAIPAIEIAPGVVTLEEPDRWIRRTIIPITWLCWVVESVST